MVMETTGTPETNGRQQRGLEIAARFRVRRTIGGWLVPSQSGSGRYTVVMGEAPTCTCLDFETRGVKCKHVFAVEYVIERERAPDGSTTVTETLRVTETVRRTYPQNWPAYNAAQTGEKDQFMVLLRDLCRGLSEPPREGKRGRPRLPVADAVFSATFKVYSTFSARRFMCDLRLAHARGFIGSAPCHNAVLNVLENPAIAPVLRSLITESSRPLRTVESDFAVDSTGFSTSRFDSWAEHKYGDKRQRGHAWVKAHVMCGVKTNVVTAVEIHGRDAADSPQLPALLEATAGTFAIADVCADKGYSGRHNADVIADAGGTPYIAYKKTTTAALPIGVWEKMFGLFLYNREAWLTHYHKRSNVESTFSMIKRKFGDSLRSRTDTAMVNETLAKILCHNLVVLIHEMHGLGINPSFWAGSAGAQEIPASA